MTQSLSSEAVESSWLARLQPSEVAARRVTWGLAALSFCLALWSYFGDRSLWLDEAMVALNIVYLPWDALTGALAYDQIAPVGWLFTQKALHLLIPDLEQSLRLLSLAAWAGTLIVFRNLVVRTFAPVGAIAAMALFALAVPFVQYAAEAKPYEFDLLVGAAGLALFAEIHRSARISPGLWIGFALLALLTVTFTLGGVLGLAGFGGLSILSLLLRRRFADASGLAGICACAAAAFVGLYHFLYHPQVAGSDLVVGASAQFFERTFYAPLPPTSMGDVAWYANWADIYFTFAFAKTSRVLGFLLATIGLVVLVGRDRMLALAWLAPLALGLAVSSLHLYPMFERLTFYTMPALFWTVGAALDWLGKSDGRRLVAVGCLTLAAMSASLIDIAGYSRLKPPYARQDIRPAMQVLKAQARPGDKIYVTNLTIPGFLTYRDRLGLRGVGWLAGRTRQTDWPCVMREVPGLRSGDTLWVLAIYDAPPDFLDDDLGVSASTYGLSARLSKVYDAHGALLYRATFAAAGPPSAPPRLDCGFSVKNNYFDVPQVLTPYLNAR